jgi:putative FmdB family regulatory protein
MPIYEYRCKQGHTFEVMQRMTDGPVVACETCSAEVDRVFHPIAVHFKGSGFYNTDYGTRRRSREMKEAAEGSGKHSKDDGASKSDSTSGGSSKSDSNSGGSSKSDSNSSGSSKSDSNSSGSSKSDSGSSSKSGSSSAKNSSSD